MGLIGDESKHGRVRFRRPVLGALCRCARCLQAALSRLRRRLRRFRAPDHPETTSGAVAAIIIQPMQGTAGSVVPPTEFLPAIQSIAKEIGALLSRRMMRVSADWTRLANHSDVVCESRWATMGHGFPISGVISSDIVTAEPFARASARHRATAATRSRRPRRSPRSKRSSTRVS
jgi:hypothetical protein